MSTELDLKLIPLEFEQTYFFEFLEKELELVNMYNYSTNCKVTQKEWNMSAADTKHICLIIKNRIDDLKLLNQITIENEKDIIFKILKEILKQLNKYVKINDGDTLKEFSNLNMIKNPIINKNNEILVEDYKDKNVTYLDKLSNNMEFLKVGVCRDYSMYFLSIFQMLGFGLNQFTLVLLPCHVFVRYINKKLNLNFETMYGQRRFDKLIYSNEEYREKFNIIPVILEKSYYLKNCDENMIFSIFYNNYGIILFKIFRENEKAEQNFKESIKLNPNGYDFYNNYNFFVIKVLDNYEKAIPNIKKIIEFNPTDAENYFIYGRILEITGISNVEYISSVYVRYLKLITGYEDEECIRYTKRYIEENKN
ncbi:MAG: hypothetical protein HRU03_01405 [Nanoarchaeales archaeon]|nr:hypothetical protein [Nanoarchaeales archaeon]